MQTLGVVSVAAFTAAAITAVFLLIKKTIGLRVSREEELCGLDLPEHGLVSAYADFMPSIAATNADVQPQTVSDALGSPAEGASVTVQHRPAAPAASDAKITKLEILLKLERFAALKEALTDIGITGMTVTNVMGCGIQQGKQEYYRGVVQEVKVLPRLKMEDVVCRVRSRLCRDAKKVLYTGHIGAARYSSTRRERRQGAPGEEATTPEDIEHTENKCFAAVKPRRVCGRYGHRYLRYGFRRRQHPAPAVRAALDRPLSAGPDSERIHLFRER